MFRTRVLMLLWLFVQSAYSFSWDIVVGEGKRLDFYNNGILAHTEDIPSVDFIRSVAYDPVHYRVLFADRIYPNVSISSFDLSTKKIQPLLTRKTNGDAVTVVYDPVTQLLFWKDYDNIYSFSLNPASPNKAVDGNILVKMDHACRDIALDSCGGYIYWVTDFEIVRARFDDSEREVLMDGYVYNRQSVAIDQQSQKMYWIETKEENDYYQQSLESADFHGKNRKTLHIFVGNRRLGNSLALTKDFIYWKNYEQVGIWQLPKISTQHLKGKLFSTSRSDCPYCQHIAVNYTIQELIQGTKSCESLKNLIPNISKPESTVSICQNYCLQGDCSVSTERQPICSCKTGYSGERCEVNACHKHCLNNGVCSLNEEDEPVCHCTEDYDGERCGISKCKDYCLQGNCSVNTEGQPKCSCGAGYSGKRCEINACHKHCLNNGVCFLNEEDEAVCECTTDYEGVRCDVATTCTGVHADNTTPQVLRDLHGEVKQVSRIREELQRTLQFYLDKIDENAAKIQKCEKSMSNDLQNRDKTTLKTQTSNTIF